MATTQPEIWQTIIDHRTGTVHIRSRMVITDDADGITRISRDNMERVEVVRDNWPALNTFMTKLLAKANDGRYGRSDVVFVPLPELPEEEE